MDTNIEQQATEGQSVESVSEGSQPQQQESQQVETKTEETISRLEYNKVRETERKLRSELARLSKQYESAKPGISLHEVISKSSPEKILKIRQIIEAQEEAAQEDESWLGELDERVANKFKDLSKTKNFVERDLMARINQLEQKLNSTEGWTTGQNERVINNTFDKFLTENKIFPEINAEIEETPKYKMIQSYVIDRLKEINPNPKLVSIEELTSVLEEVKSGLSDMNKQELTKSVQQIVPPSGSKTGQIPKSEKITNEDVTDLWSSFKKGVGW